MYFHPKHQSQKNTANERGLETKSKGSGNAKWPGIWII